MATHPTGIFCAAKYHEWEQVEELVARFGEERVRAVAQAAAGVNGDGKAYVSCVRALLQKERTHELSKVASDALLNYKSAMETDATREAQGNHAFRQVGEKILAKRNACK